METKQTSGRQPHITVLVVMALLAIAAAKVSKPTQFTYKELTKKVRMPTPKKVKEQMSRRGVYPIFKCCLSADAVENGSREMYYLAKQGTKEYQPFYLLKTGSLLTALNQDQQAFQLLADVLELADNTAYNSAGMAGFPKTLVAVKRSATLLRARILARNGLRKEVVKELTNFKPRTGYENLLLAEIYARLGDREKAIDQLKAATQKPQGHPVNNWSRTFIPMRAVVIADAMGERGLAKTLGERYVRRGLKAQKWPQWKAAWAIMDKTPKTELDLKSQKQQFRDGDYRGSCRGFNSEIEVEVSIRKGRIVHVKILNSKESRPFSAIKAMPERIVKQQGLDVDAVTGATISSCSILVATKEALSKATP